MKHRTPYYYQASEFHSYFHAWAEFGRDYVAPKAAALDAANEFNHEAWKRLADEGFWKWIATTKKQIFDTQWWDFSATLQGLASEACDSGFIVSAIAQAATVYTIYHYHSNHLYKNKVLDAVNDDGVLIATAIAEPHTGTDVRALKTIAETKNGKLLLNGEKTNISHAPTAEYILVLARMPELGKKDLALFLLGPENTGIERGTADDKLGNRTLPTSWLKFNDVEILPHQIIGKGDTVNAIDTLMGLARGYYGMVGPQLFRPLLKRAQTHINARQSGNKPLSEHQHIQRKISECILSIEQAHWTGMGAVANVMEGNSRRSLAGSIAKITGMRAMEQISRDILSILGSEGYKDELVTRMLRDTMGWMNIGGTEEAHLINIFNHYAKGGLRYDEPYEMNY